MIPDGDYVAVLDRFEDDQAVLLIEDDGETVAQATVSGEWLPQEGCHQDAILEVTVRDGNPVDASYDEAATDRRATEAQDRFDRLAERPPREDEDGD